MVILPRCRGPEVHTGRSTPGITVANRRCNHGFLTAELIVALGILGVALLPLSYSFLHERQLIRAYYTRALAMEIVDGEMEVLLAGEWSHVAEGSHNYPVRAEAAQNLPPGQFVVFRKEQRLRLEWAPKGRGKGGIVFREVRLP